MALVTLQMIFQDAFPAYEQTHLLPSHVRRAARAIMQCRTATLGGHVQACPCAVPIIPLPGPTPPGFASRHVAEWFHIRIEKPCYQSQLFPLQRVSRVV